MELVKDSAKSSQRKICAQSLKKQEEIIQEPIQIKENHFKKIPQNQITNEIIFSQQLQADFEVIDKITKFLKETEMQEKNQIEEYEPLSSPIQNLPTEIIYKIFNFLSFSERKSASMVCKKWRNHFLESYYFKNIMVKANNQLFVSNRPSSTSTHGLGHLHRASSAMALSDNLNFSNHLFTNLVNIEFINDSADVSLMVENLKKIKDSNANFTLPKLKTLNFNRTTMSASSLISLINEAPGLEQLSLIECDSLFMTGFLSIPNQSRIDRLENLKSLFLGKNRYLTDKLLNIFIDSTNKLTDLDLSYCNFTKTKFKSVKNTSLNANSLSNCVLTFENLISKLNHFFNLESLNLSGVENLIYNQDSFFEFIEVLPSLGRIHLENLPNLKLETGIQIIENMKNLIEINLNNSIQNYDLKQNGIEALIEKSCSESGSSIQILRISRANINNRKIFSDTFSAFHQLKHLDLSCLVFNSTFGTATKLNEFIDSFSTNISKCDKLEHLNLSYCDFLVNDNFVRIISNSLIKLKHLNIRNCSHITDTSLHLISSSFKKLVHLDLSWCNNISDHGLDYSINLDQDKKTLNEFRKHINGNCRCIKAFAEQPFLMIKAKNGLVIERSTRFFGCLSKVNQQEQNLEVDTKQFFGSNRNSSLKNLRELKVLKLESCSNITDLGIYNGINWEKLVEFNLNLCTNVTGDFVKSEEKSFTNLKILTLNQCLKFEEDNLLYLIERSPNLKELAVAGLSNVTNNLIDTLLRLRKFLVLFDISFCSNMNESNVDKYEQFLCNVIRIRDFKIDKRFISK